MPLSANKAAAELLLADLLRKIERERAGVHDPHERHRKRPLADHLAEWKQSLTDSNATGKHVRQMFDLASEVVNGCGFVFPSDLSGSQVRQYLADLQRPRAADTVDPKKADYTKKELAELLGIAPSAVPSLVSRHRLAAVGNGKARRFPRQTAASLTALRDEGLSVRTDNRRLVAVKAFSRWMVRDRRMSDDPFVGLSGGNPEHDRRREFATLTAEEVRILIDAARRSRTTVRGFTGQDRAALYALGIATAFRPQELARLTAKDFALDGATPFVRLDGGRTKNGRAAEQPLTAEVARMFREYLPNRPTTGSLWPGGWFEKAADLIRNDLIEAGLPVTKPGPDEQSLPVAFYSLRHSAGLLAELGGASLREVMTLMRHSDPKLTMRTYGRLRLQHLGEAVEKMPNFLSKLKEIEPVTLAATGTYDVRRVPLGMPPCAPTGDIERGRLKTFDETTSAMNGKKRRENNAIEENREPTNAEEESAPNGTLFEPVSETVSRGNSSRATLWMSSSPVRF